jgi:hypothetical protein
VQPEDVVHVLRNMVDAVRPGGLVLDLQVIRPNPVVEADGERLCEIDGEPLLKRADAATAAVDDYVASGLLAEEAIDDHEVRTHFADGPELVDHFDQGIRNLPPNALPGLRALTRPCAIREPCRIRRLRVTTRSGTR